MGRLSGFQTPHFVAQVQNGRSSDFLSIILWDSFSVLFFSKTRHALPLPLKVKFGRQTWLDEQTHHLISKLFFFSGGGGAQSTLTFSP